MYRLDRESFAALASPSRIAVLKVLSTRNHTITELAQRLGKSAPTIREHMRALRAADLVTMTDTGHKWKYYRLTKKGKSIFEPDRSFSLDLPVLVISAAGTITSLAAHFLRAAPGQASATAEAFAADLAARSAPTPEPSILLPVLAALFLLLTIAAAVRFATRK